MMCFFNLSYSSVLLVFVLYAMETVCEPSLLVYYYTAGVRDATHSHQVLPPGGRSRHLIVISAIGFPTGPGVGRAGASRS